MNDIINEENKNVCMVFASFKIVVCLCCGGFFDGLYFCLGTSSKLLIFISREEGGYIQG
jgi:hypothetical protein